MKAETITILGVAGAAIWLATRTNAVAPPLATAPPVTPGGSAVFNPGTTTPPANTSDDASKIQQAQIAAASIAQHIAAVLSQAQYLMTNSGITPAGAAAQLASIQTAAQTAYTVLQSATTLALVNQAAATLQTTNANAVAALQAITAAIAAAQAAANGQHTTTPPPAPPPADTTGPVEQTYGFYNQVMAISQSATQQTQATGIYPGGALDQIAQAVHDVTTARSVAQTAASTQTAMAAASAAQVAYSSAVTALQTLSSIIAQVQEQQHQQQQQQQQTGSMTLAQVEDALYAKLSALPPAVLHTQGDGTQVAAAVPPYIYTVGDPSDPRLAPLGMRQATQAQVDDLRPLLAAQSSLEGH